MKTYSGGCHCGAVRYEVDVVEQIAYDCNCSMCRKKGFLHIIVPKEQFRLLSGGDCLTTYTFNTGVAKHHFCKICGIHSFYIPRSHPDGVDVNHRCLDGEVMNDFQIKPFDGQNWEGNVESIR